MPKESIGSVPTARPLDAKTFSAIVEKENENDAMPEKDKT
jgi:hypothetical protein